ncbi:transglycosylase SLT domain-containing protein [Nocardia sp. CA-135953]|uniref:aggregation-promoting factor C-terminal-like domain-containing protein n=1 Tax=Nocardia sp. CA-135953 TaxID=3239978 RepID=UPI003D96BA19
MLRVVAAAIAVGALMVCAGPAVAEGLCDSVVTFANAPNDDAATSADSLADSGPTSADGLNDSATSANIPDSSAATSADSPGGGINTSADRPNDRVTPSANGPDDGLATPTDGPSESDSTPTDRPNGGTTTPANFPDSSATTSADSLGESDSTSADSVTPSTDGLDGSLALSAEESDNIAPGDESDETVAVTPAASPPDSGTTPAGLALSLIRLGTRALALTVVPLHQFPAFDAVITHESGWDVFAINPKSGAYGLGQALPAEKMQTHGADWRFNPLTQIRWTYDYMNERYGSPNGAWAFWQTHHWY